MGRPVDGKVADVNNVIAADSRDPLLLGVDLFLSSWLATLPAALCAVLVGQLPSAYALWQGLPLSLDESKDITWWVLMGLAAIINLACWVFIMRQQGSRLRGDEVSVLGDLQVSLRKIPQAVAVLCGMLLLVAFGTLLLIVPGVYLLVVSWLVLPAVAACEGNAREIIDSCLQRARGRWWVLAKGLLLTVIGILALFVVGNLLGLLLFELLLVGNTLSPESGAESSGSLVGTLATLIGGVLGALYMPFAAAMAVAHHAVLAPHAPISDNNSA